MLKTTRVRVLADMGNIQETGAPPLIRETLILIIGAVVLLLSWSAITGVKEVAHVPGQVIPKKSVQTVQHLEGGIVAEVLVQESQLVEKDQSLLRMDSNMSVPEREQAVAQLRGLEARALRLRAFLAEGKRAKEYIIALQKDPLYTEQWEIYQNQKISLQNNLSVLDSQIAQRQADIDQAKGELEDARKQYEVTASLVKIRKDLIEQQAISRLIYLETLRAHIVAKGEIERFKKQIENQQAALQEVQQRRKKAIADTYKTANDELAVIVNEIAQVKEMLTKMVDRVERTEVRAPIRGIIQELKVHIPGTVVQSGEVLMRVVPVEDYLEVEARIPPNDIGRVAVGQTVVVKISSYEFSRFGTVSGKLSTLSSSVLADEQGTPYYRGGISLSRYFVGDEPGRYPITSGMQAQIDILLGEKTILKGMVVALQRATSGGFNER
ncbi:MAG: HlyD family type I secretion periplasmic adaptor subunit [Magnetococcales bacterium]|nr:HlyD family type I secretion periplasmic adaptor subunit [Magnetococcales bacterium]MBF0115979.1 HlyD family type I secretion periplasmic adaptor subunit [Magnetococcales bacterium]